MSLSIVITSASGIVVVADRRVGSAIHPHLVDAEKFGHFRSGVIYFDGNKKIVVYNEPHNFVAFTYTGSGSIDSHKLIEELEKELPGERLPIKEYGESLLKLYFKDPDRYRFGHEPFSQDASNCIYVIGYDKGSAKALLYQIDLPFQPGPIPKDMHPGGILISGVGDFLEVALDEVREREIEKLNKKIAGNRLVGAPTRIQEATLQLIKNDRIQWSAMQLQQIQDYAEFIIAHTVAQQSALNETPSVGGGTDVIRITKRKGVEKIKYEPYFPVGKRPIAETHYHHAVLSCCGREVKIQIDLDLNNPLGKSHVRFPANEKFQCSSCGMVHDLTDARNFVQELLGYHVIVNEKSPTTS